MPTPEVQDQSGLVVFSWKMRCLALDFQGQPGSLSLRLHLFLLLLLLSASPMDPRTLKPSLSPVLQNRPFLVVWNAPTSRCRTAFGLPLPLEPFGVVANDQEVFAGGNITIFYQHQLGLYPHYQAAPAPVPLPVHGGCPQNASLRAHLDAMERDLEAAIPSRAFSGLSVIDWETWRPLWVRNWDKKGVYRTMSTHLVRQRYPTWPQGRVELQAQWEFETAAARFMSETLRLARARRPGGWWGYYLFPDCYNYHYWEDFENFTGHCPGIERQRNDALLWLWEQSRALYPSIYLEEVLRGSAQGERFVRAKVWEALRVAELPPSARYSLPVFVYARPFYSYTLKELAQVDLEHTIGQAAAMGAQGVVLWGEADYARNQSTCLKMHHYLLSRLGPYVLNVTTAAALCSQTQCNGHGRCRRRIPDSPTYLHLEPSTFRIHVATAANHTQASIRGQLGPRQREALGRDFICHCYQGWQGDGCQESNQSGEALSLSQLLLAGSLGGLWAWTL
ncbi:hyaluronidase-like [Petaurus breviceps papuanus]|uniref:hyaluronidase-like n=1 Tax=Petaurus breviceps papuanus TaxID=3040969 RepID=UPI0036D7CD9A